MRKPETQPTGSATDPPVQGRDDTIDIEADTVEEAMERVAATLGEDAQIIDARKTVSGGIAGLFAKERVVLTARRPQGGLTSILDQMSRDVDAAETEFGVMLRRRLAAEPAAGDRPDTEPTAGEAVATEPAPAPSAVGTMLAADGEGYSLTPIDGTPVAPPPLVESSARTIVPSPHPFPAAKPVPVARPPLPMPVVAEPVRRPLVAQMPAPPGAGAVDWGRTELVRHGVPERVVAAVAATDPEDDLAWIRGVAAAVAPLCGGPLDDAGVVVGAGAARIGELLGLDVVEPCSIAPYQGGFWTPVEGTHEEQKWLDFVLAGRSLHVVIDASKAWGDLLVADPSVVSWVDSSGVGAALHLAATLGARLGFCPSAQPGDVVRATPVDVALAVRQLVRRR